MLVDAQLFWLLRLPIVVFFCTLCNLRTNNVLIAVLVCLPSAFALLAVSFLRQSKGRVEFVSEVADCGSFSLPSLYNIFADERKFRRRSSSFHRPQQT